MRKYLHFLAKQYEQFSPQPGRELGTVGRREKPQKECHPQKSADSAFDVSHGFALPVSTNTLGNVLKEDVVVFFHNKTNVWSG